MPLNPIQDGAEPSGRYLIQLLRELQGLKFAVVAGSLANTNQAVAGIGVEDTIVGAVEVADPGAALGTAVLVDRTGVASIPVDGSVAFSVATNGSGAGARVLVAWMDKSGL